MTSFDRIVAGVVVALLVAIGIEAGLGDRSGAGITDVSPSQGSAPAVTSSIQISFSQPMDHSSVESRLKISPPVVGKSSWTNNKMVFVPNIPLKTGQAYHVELSAGSLSTLGRSINRVAEWSFIPRSPLVTYLAPADGSTRSLWHVSLDGGPPTEIQHSTYGVDSYAPSPDGTRIAVAEISHDQSADLWLLDPLSGRSRQVTQCAPDFCGSPKWSPDGQRLAFERRAAGAAGEGGPSRIWIFGLASDAGAPLFQDDKILGYAPIWSPDGRTIAFVDPQTEAIDVVDLASGKVTYLPSQMGEMGSFSPDGMAMVYSDLRPVGEQVFSELWLGYLGDETKVKLLLDSSEEDQFPAWSPDGKNIAFGRRLLNRSQGLGSQLVLADPVTQAIHKLTNDPTYNNTAFAWSPSGEMLLVQRYNLVAASGRPEIWVYQLSDNHFSKVAENGYGAAWLP